MRTKNVFWPKTQIDQHSATTPGILFNNFTQHSTERDRMCFYKYSILVCTYYLDESSNDSQTYTKKSLWIGARKHIKLIMKCMMKNWQVQRVMNPLARLDRQIDDNLFSSSIRLARRHHRHIYFLSLNVVVSSLLNWVSFKNELSHKK